MCAIARCSMSAQHGFGHGPSLFPLFENFLEIKGSKPPVAILLMDLHFSKAIVAKYRPPLNTIMLQRMNHRGAPPLPLPSTPLLTRFVFAFCTHFAILPRWIGSKMSQCVPAPTRDAQFLFSSSHTIWSTNRASDGHRAMRVAISLCGCAATFVLVLAHTQYVLPRTTAHVSTTLPRPMQARMTTSWHGMFLRGNFLWCLYLHTHCQPPALLLRAQLQCEFVIVSFVFSLCVGVFFCLCEQIDISHFLTLLRFLIELSALPKCASGAAW